MGIIKMVIYEVNLCIDKEIVAAYKLWLHNHIKEILKLPGFIQAMILKEENEDAQEKLTVQYQLETRENLENYFTNHAAQMREDGKKLFGEKFSATRRIFMVSEKFE